MEHYPIANPDVVLREEFDDWAVLFNPDSAAAVGMSPVGVAIWKLLDGKHSLVSIAEKLKDDFSDVPGDVSEHIRAFIEDLAVKGFVSSGS